MGGHGRNRNRTSRWRFSFLGTSSSPSSDSPQTPSEFLCPISGSIMFDPVVVSSGQSFDRTSAQVCLDLSFSPTLSDGSITDFSTVIPNLALKSAIDGWCTTYAVERPRRPCYGSVELAVRKFMLEEANAAVSSPIRVSEKELLNNVADKPSAPSTRVASEPNRRVDHYSYCSSSSEESVIANVSMATPLHPFTIQASCYSSSSSTSTSSEIVSDEIPNPLLTASEDEEFVAKFKSLDVFQQEQGVISLRKTTRTDESARILLCTPRLLSNLRPLLWSRYAVVQSNAAAALVNMSLEKANKVKMVRSGLVPPLIDLLKGGFVESQEHAAAGIFSLALEDENKTAIGVLGALQPLLHALRSENEQMRSDSALALYHLSLVHSNRAKLVKLGAVNTLLAMLSAGDLGRRVLLVLCNLAASAEGRSAMLDSNAVECLVGMLRRESDRLGASETSSARENCVAALYLLSQGSMRFKTLAREAGAAELLAELAERGSPRVREKAGRILAVLRVREEEDVDWERLLEG